MKNLILVYITSLLISLSLSSCSDDTVYDPVVEDGLFSFEITVPSSEMRTRAYADGNTVSELVCYVYNHGSASGTLPSRSEQITINTVDGKRGGTIGLDLPSAGVYDFVFVATSCKQDDKTSKIYYDPAARTLNVNYQKLAGNDEEADCFYGVLENVSLSKGSSYKVTLRRPMAQLNIGASDLEEYNTLTSSSLKSVGVTVDGVYSSMDVMDGSVTGQPIKVTLPEAALPVGQTFPTNDAAYLSMSYLLVNERRDVNVTLTAGNGATTFDTEFKDVPLQRNHQTNIHGNLLTATNDFKVEINPGFVGSGNKDVEDPYADYDLVLEMANTWGSCYLQAISHETNKYYDRMYLNGYKDSNNIIKLRWEDLGIDEARQIIFRGNSTNNTTIPNIKSVMKCDINKIGVTFLSNIFYNCKYLESVEAVKDWDTSKCTDIWQSFYNCTDLKEIDLSNFQTQNMQNFSYAFYNCSSLKSLDLSNFETENLIYCHHIFENCSKLEELDLSGWSNDNLENMEAMFKNCYALAELNMKNFQAPKVTSFYQLFYNCRSLRELDLNSLYTTNLRNMKEMFYMCSSLENLNIEHVDTSNVTTMEASFYYCSSLKSLDLINFHTKCVQTMQNMFCFCSSLESLDINLDTSNVTTMSGMFSNCKKLAEINVSSFDTSKVVNTAYMFNACNTVSKLDVTNFDTSNVTTMEGMFSDCWMLKKLNLSNFNTSKVSTMKKMFDMYNTSNLESNNYKLESKMENLDISNFDTSNVTDMSFMFNHCKTLKALDINHFDTSKVTTMESMFNNCTSITKLLLSNFKTSATLNMSQIFSGCSILNTLDISNFDTSNVSNMSGMFNYCQNLSNLTATIFNTRNCTDLSSIFNNCDLITDQMLSELGVEDFDTSKVTNMRAMFSGCKSIVALDLSNYNTSNVTTMQDMFYHCEKLENINVTHFDTYKVKDFRDMFNGCSSLQYLDLSSFYINVTGTYRANMTANCPAEVIMPAA